MCSCCLVSHIRREPEAETKDSMETPEAAAAEQQKQHKSGSRSVLGGSGSSGNRERPANGQRERGEGDDSGRRSGGRWTRSFASNHAWASGGVALRRSRVRRGLGERGGSGSDGSGGGASAAAKTSELGQNDESPTTKLETARREATSTFRSRWDLNVAWGPAKLLQWATVVGLVDSAREENKARAVIEIYLHRG